MVGWRAATWQTHLCSESTEKCKEELAKSEGKVLVEEVAQEGGHPVIGPAAMNQKKTFQVPAREFEREDGQPRGWYLPYVQKWYA